MLQLSRCWFCVCEGGKTAGPTTGPCGQRGSTFVTFNTLSRACAHTHTNTGGHDDERRRRRHDTTQRTIQRSHPTRSDANAETFSAALRSARSARERIPAPSSLVVDGARACVRSPRVSFWPSQSAGERTRAAQPRASVAARSPLRVERASTVARCISRVRACMCVKIWKCTASAPVFVLVAGGGGLLELT